MNNYNEVVNSTGILINENLICEKLNEFQAEMRKMDLLLEKILTNSGKLKDSWKGKSSDKILDPLIKKINNDIDLTNFKNSNYYHALEDVISLYKSLNKKQEELAIEKLNS